VQRVEQILGVDDDRLRIAWLAKTNLALAKNRRNAISDVDSVHLDSKSISVLVGDSGGCRSVFRGMPITRSGMMAITIPG